MQTYHHANHSIQWNRFFLAMVVFTFAYFTTITVHAQTAQGTADAVSFGKNENTVFTGTVTDASAETILIQSLGKPIKVDLEDVNMETDASTIFTNGMQVRVEGRMSGNDSGVPVMKAKYITAVANPTGVSAPGVAVQTPPAQTRD